MDTLDTFNRPAQKKRTDGQRDVIPASRALEQAEPNANNAADEGRLQMSVSVGKKGETIQVPPDEVESLRPEADEMKDG